jgi:transposase
MSKSAGVTGRSAYDPKVLLKIVLYGYYRGIISSRQLAEACRRNVVFMALFPALMRI